MNRHHPSMFVIGIVLLFSAFSSAATFATYGANGCASGSPAYPAGLRSDNGSDPNKRLYRINFSSHDDNAADFYYLGLPHSFDSTKSYPLWFQFKPRCGSGTNICMPTFAWNYCDSNYVIYIGADLRMALSGNCDEYYGDNTGSSQYGPMIGHDMIEIVNEMCYLFNIQYVAASGASMGGSSTIRFLGSLPKSYIGAAVPSCPSVWDHPYTQAGSDAIGDSAAHGHFNQVFVKLLHGTADPTVPIGNSDALTALVPDKQWWEEVRISGAGHGNFFYVSTSNGWPHDEEAGRSSQVPDMWQQIKNWETAHPEKVNRSLPPIPGWVEPSRWYVPQNIYNARDAAKPTRIKEQRVNYINNLELSPLTKSGSVEFKVTLNRPGDFSLKVYDLSGKTVWDRFINAGDEKTFRINWNASNNKNVPSNGIYFVSVEQGRQKIVKKFFAVR